MEETPQTRDEEEGSCKERGQGDGRSEQQNAEIDAKETAATGRGNLATSQWVLFDGYS